MPQIDYPRVIAEDQEELKKLEKRHRYSHLFHRVKMLRLLKSGECSNLGEAAKESPGLQPTPVPEVVSHLQAGGFGGAIGEQGGRAWSH